MAHACSDPSCARCTELPSVWRFVELEVSEPVPGEPEWVSELDKLDSGVWIGHVEIAVFLFLLLLLLLLFFILIWLI